MFQHTYEWETLLKTWLNSESGKFLNSTFVFPRLKVYTGHLLAHMRCF